MPSTRQPAMLLPPASLSREGWRAVGTVVSVFFNLRSMPANPHKHVTLARPRFSSNLRTLAFGMTLALLTQTVLAQEWRSSQGLPKYRFRSGEETLRAFAPISAATRQSIVKFNVDGETVALGAVADTNGLVLTKASELKPGKLTCWLATEKEVVAQVLKVDEEEDVALVRVDARGLKPLRWAAGEVRVGQWAITPGLAATPHAVGIISALPHRVRPQRALIGVRFDFGTATPRIDELLPGLGAEQAGLKPGDLILAVNSVTVTSRQQVVEVLSDFRAGQTVKLRVGRAADQFDAEVRLMSPSSSRFGADPEPRPGLDRLGGEVSVRAEGFESAIEHDTVLPPWLCGGPLVNLDGEAIGLNIARAGRVTTYALSARLVQRIFENLKSAAQSTMKTGTPSTPPDISSPVKPVPP